MGPIDLLERSKRGQDLFYNCHHVVDFEAVLDIPALGQELL